MREIAQSPKIVTFCCNWSVVSGLRLSTFADKKDNTYRTVVTMCAGRLDPELILQAFKHGAWGVLIAACPLGECEHDGNYKTLRRVLLLKNLLRQFNIEPERIKIEWVGTGESAKLGKAIDNFLNEIKELGPLQ
mgnify:CR=1 FL=1